MLFIPVILGKMAVVVGIAAVVVEALVVVVSVSEVLVVEVVDAVQPDPLTGQL